MEWIFVFFDITNDKILSAEDALDGVFRDQNDDGVISLNEILGVSRIKLAAPLHRLYSRVDADQNEEISFEEAKSFVKGSLYLLDRNEDCSIDIEEVITILNEASLPSEFQLVVKLLGNYVVTLTDFLIKRIIAFADTNEDKKTSFEEILDVTDTFIITELNNVVQKLTGPVRTLMKYLQCETEPCDISAKKEMWLNVLNNMVENRKYDTVPDNLCGI